MTERVYQLSSSWDKDVLTIVLTGKAYTQNANEIADDVRRTLDEHKPDKVLIDCMKLVGRLGIIETYYHVKRYPTGGHRPDRLAVLENPENEAYASFHETTAANVGHRLKFFTDVEEAMGWLRQ